MNIIEATEILEGSDFDGHMECESQDSEDVKCIISFDKDAGEWRTTVCENNRMMPEMKQFYALPQQITSNAWVVWSNKQQTWITDYD